MRAEYIMVGGFLGAGKTTALLRLAQHMTAQGRRVGLITNDQSYGLVDSVLVGAHGFPVEEITGGCFCCRFDSLIEARCLPGRTGRKLHRPASDGPAPLAADVWRRLSGRAAERFG
jgi:Ni2+-binding GTPase involved in maturation of urease and hydrogenase